ncbi:MAG: YkgJ family cysteine cluster protein [Deltaproteobacteria bacterium]|nr:YkgJ family cysteine cluster protein [Deltaproteobacteria bacterium]MBW2660566.1 YkgJ family cysteine cluster protein [Deltaproteobacteria bacterium]
MDILQKKGFDFGFDPRACKNCFGRCCIGKSGNIWVNKEEIEKIADFLDLSAEGFIKYYLRKVYYKYSLKELKINDSFQCVFFDDKNKNCSIYKVRPTQCRTFPFWEYFKNNTEEVIKECPGIKIQSCLKGWPRPLSPIKDPSIETSSPRSE